MIFRLGYVAMTLNLEDASPSSTITATAFNKIQDQEARMNKLRKIAQKNIRNSLRILIYNKATDIKVYRFTSKIIPLATHPLVQHWDYCSELKDEFIEIGNFVKENGFRVSAHPDHFTLINSPKEHIFYESLKDLEYHANIFEAMGLEEAKYKLVMHVGGVYKDKKTSMQNFKNNFHRLPDRVRKRIILENDDKSYTASEVLELCKELSIPMVFDVHHHKCVNNGERIEDLLEEIFHTWEGESWPPKIHFSSPKSEKDFRSHADYVQLEEFLQFLQAARLINRDFDVMLEAKNKDNALLKLSSELEKVGYIKKINTATFEM